MDRFETLTCSECGESSYVIADNHVECLACGHVGVTGDPPETGEF